MSTSKGGLNMIMNMKYRAARVKAGKMIADALSFRSSGKPNDER